MRSISPGDLFIQQIDMCIRTLANTLPNQRSNPSDPVMETDLSEPERKRSIGLMRINHTGEVCAQALYQGQALAARDKKVRQAMQESAEEEIDHLAWCAERLHELGGHTSYLNPLWWFGSFAIGFGAGLAGDKWSLGFVAQTENQVVKHLKSHLERLPEHDHKSRAIVSQMIWDESEHEQKANDYGAAMFPEPMKQAMSYTSKLMTSLTYYV